MGGSDEEEKKNSSANENHEYKFETDLLIITTIIIHIT